MPLVSALEVVCRQRSSLFPTMVNLHTARQGTGRAEFQPGERGRIDRSVYIN